jgi:hypothetical protein
MNTDSDSDDVSPSSLAKPSGGGFFKLGPGQTYSESSSHALLGLFLYSALMFTLPLLAFFGSKHLFEEHFELASPYSQLAPAIVAIIVVNVIIITYVIKAFREEAKERPLHTQSIEQRKKAE